MRERSLVKAESLSKLFDGLSVADGGFVEFDTFSFGHPFTPRNLVDRFTSGRFPDDHFSVESTRTLQRLKFWPHSTTAACDQSGAAVLDGDFGPTHFAAVLSSLRLDDLMSLELRLYHYLSQYNLLRSPRAHASFLASERDVRPVANGHTLSFCAEPGSSLEHDASLRALFGDFV
jgi:hypothetical protein